MKERSNFKESARHLKRLTGLLIVFFLAIAGLLLYLLADPTLSAFTNNRETDLVVVEKEGESTEEIDKIENGIHVRTGFVDGEGLMTVVNNCTNCHSAKLVTQNRMTAEGWKATIDWMQETQNLWELGENEAIIINYLATHYAPERKGRRENLTNIEWYELKEP